MRDRVERLRVWLAGSAVFLLLVIAGFIGYARFQSRLHHFKLPGKLGIDVVRESGGWTLSHAAGSRTQYAIHAATSEQHTNGKVALHDVYILLYGKDGNRRDRICGQDFEYDEKAGVVRALGLVHMDLQAAEAGEGNAAGSAAGAGRTGAESAKAGSTAPCSEVDGPGTKILHVTTSGLVYLEKLGVAATSEYIEFKAGDMTGHATGADFSSDSGMLMLHSAVSMSGIAGGRPSQVTASTAEYDEHSGQAFLTHAKYDSPGRTAEAERVTLHRRTDGTLSEAEAQGNVTVVANGATVVSQRADVMLTATSQPHSAVLTGGVLYTSDAPLRQARGQANEATISFDAGKNPQPDHAVFTGAVHMIERTRATEAVRERWSVRELTAAKFDAVLAPSGQGKSQLRTVEAVGGAHLTEVNNGSLASTSGEGRTELSADDLKAALKSAAGPKQSPQLDTIAGRGHTVLVQADMNGVEETSTGDTLDAKFREASVPGAKQAKETLWSAVQQGHVNMIRRAPGRNSAKDGTKSADTVKVPNDVQRGMADRAVYDGDQNRVTLSGGVQLTDAGSDLWAKQVVLDRSTSNVQAVGGVKVDYDSSKAGTARAAGPTHILAERAEFEHSTEIATFFGKPARLWQDGSQVQAPEIEVSRVQQRLIARSGASTGWTSATQAALVHTILMSGGNAGNTARPGSDVRKEPAAKCGSGTSTGGKAGTPTGTAQVARIASGGLIYSGILRQADFTGGVRVDTVDATMRANQATAYLEQTGASDQGAGKTARGGGPATPSLAGNLDRVVADGHIDVERPGLQATGERLVYTASDRVFLLTGDKNNPPKATDAQGTTTGAALRFNSCDDSGGGSVEALGAVPGGPVQRAHSESRVSSDKKKEKGKP
jgi:lipopolysaccharide export system protein LptA